MKASKSSGSNRCRMANRARSGRLSNGRSATAATLPGRQMRTCCDEIRQDEFQLGGKHGTPGYSDQRQCSTTLDNARRKSVTNRSNDNWAVNEVRQTKTANLGANTIHVEERQHPCARIGNPFHFASFYVEQTSNSRAACLQNGANRACSLQTSRKSTNCRCKYR